MLLCEVKIGLLRIIIGDGPREAIVQTLRKGVPVAGGCGAYARVHHEDTRQESTILERYEIFIERNQSEARWTNDMVAIAGISWIDLAQERRPWHKQREAYAQQ